MDKSTGPKPDPEGKFPAGRIAQRNGSATRRNRTGLQSTGKVLVGQCSLIGAGSLSGEGLHK